MKLKSFHTNAALILTALMLAVAAATTVATAQTYTDLYNFDGTHGDGSGYPGILAQGRDGNLYGTTLYGGVSQCGYGYGCGVVFKITPSGKLKVLHKFDSADGLLPYSGLTLGKDGNFYGTSEQGGADNWGTIFKITPKGSLTTLYSFTEGADGADPVAPPIQGTDGDLYGTTWAWTVYKITSSGTFAVFAAQPGPSAAPLLLGTDGDFYGTTVYGGSSSVGTLFKITPKGIVKIVYTFDGTNGAEPYGPVIQSSDGNFYGTTYQGGSYGEGVVFKLTPHGAITVLHNFGDLNYPNDGAYPLSGLLQATDGNFYGVALEGGTMDWGVIFQITPAGTYSILYNFDWTHGGAPESSLMQHTNGKIYGLTSGGEKQDGVVYSFDMGLGPFVSLVSTTGKVGKTVEILGQGFTNTTAVAFNGTPAAFTVKRDTFLKTTVPSGATTGFVTVTTPSGTLTSNKEFRVKQ